MRALILGGTGLIGSATARRLLGAGWQVDVTGRDPANLPADVAEAGGRFLAVERHDAAALARQGGADLLVDCICFTARDAELLVPLARDATSTVMISSKAVYRDEHGNHSNSDTPPVFAGPVTEAQPTVAPGDMDYDSREGYGANKVAAEGVGAYPWDKPDPFVLDTSAATALGYKPAGDYAATVAETVDWLVAAQPQEYGAWFDYAAENACLASVRRG